MWYCVKEENHLHCNRLSLAKMGIAVSIEELLEPWILTVRITGLDLDEDGILVVVARRCSFLELIGRSMLYRGRRSKACSTPIARSKAMRLL